MVYNNVTVYSDVINANKRLPEVIESWNRPCCHPWWQTLL